MADLKVKICPVFSVFTTRRVISGADSRRTGKLPSSSYTGEFLCILVQYFLIYLSVNIESRIARFC